MVRSRPSKDLKRRQAFRTPNKSELIVCEGSKTEQAYFASLRRELRLYAVRIHVFSPDESDPMAIVEQAIAKKKEVSEPDNPCERVWCVVDVEIPPHEALDRAWERAKSVNKLELILTNPCIEYWFLLHFGKHTDSFGNKNDAMKALKEVHSSYKKRSIGFDILYPHTGEAIRHSKEVLEEKRCGEYIRDCNPSTHMHKIVEHLQNLQ